MTRLGNDLVSAIIPVYNRPAMLRQAVECVLGQTYRPVEVIVVDDGSTDDTPHAARTLARQYPGVVRVVRQENAGPGPARNRGLSLARGEFIQYLDSDDLLEPAKFARQVQALREHPDRGVAYCLTLRPGADGTPRPWARTGEAFDSILPEFLIQRGWHTVTPLWRRSVCEAIGPWGAFRVMEDWEHDCRAGMLGVRPVYCPEPLARVRDHAGDRASGMGVGFTPELTRHYFEAHRSIYDRLRAANLTGRDTMLPFSRKLFWLARRCALKGLRAEAQQSLAMAMEAARPFASMHQMNAFKCLARVAGWRTAARLSEGVRGLTRAVIVCRRRRPLRHANRS